MNEQPLGGGVEQWPRADLDGVARIRMLAGLVPNAQLVERVLDAPCADVWEYLADVETSVPAFDGEVKRLTITGRDGDLVAMRVRSRFMPPQRFTGHIVHGGRDGGRHGGHIVMRAAHRLYVVGIGVRPIDSDRTTYVQFEGVPRRAGSVLNGLIRRHTAHDARSLQAIVEGPRAGQR